MIVQARVADYVQNNGIRSSFIAEKTELSPVIVSRILSRKREMTADEFEKICRALHKQPNDFIKIEDE